MVSKTRNTRYSTHLDYGGGYSETGSFPPIGYTPQYADCFHISEGGSVPDYRRKLKSGIDATGIYTNMSNEIEIKEGFYRARWKRNPAIPNPMYWMSEGQGRLVPTFSPATDASIPGSKANNMALNDFHSQFSKSQRKIMSGVVLGELGEAVRMIRSPGRALWEHLLGHGKKAKKRLSREKPKTRRRVASELWLENVFGWRPLIGDVEDGAIAIAHILHGHPRSYIKGIGSDNVCNAGFSSVGSDVIVNSVMTQTDTHTVIIRGTVAIQANEVQPSVLKTLGLSWQDVPLTIWELMPFSFLVDYFTGVGKVISAASHGEIPLIWGNISDVKSREVIWKNTDILQQPVFQYEKEFCSSSPCYFRTRYTRFTRSSISQVGFPSIQWSWPDGLQWLNIAALSQVCRF